MTTEKVSHSEEEQIIVGLITSTQFIQEVEPILYLEYFKNNQVKTIIKWCLNYFKEYKKAPQLNILDIYTIQAEETLGKEESTLIRKYLHKIQSQYNLEDDKYNIKYSLDKAEKYIRTKALSILKEEISSKLSVNDLASAEELVKKFNRPTRLITSGIDPTSPQAIEKVFSNIDEEKLFRFSGDLGKIIGDLNRGYLVAIVAPMKRGKTWWLQEFALQAIQNSLNVLFISLEMTENQMIKRIIQSITRTPRYSQEVEIPVLGCFRKNCPDRKDIFCSCKNKEDITLLKKKVKIRGITKEIAIEKCKQFISNNPMSKKGKIKLVTFPSKSLTIENLKLQLTNWEYYDGFVPDVVITDYADKFLSQSKSSALRDQLNDIWEGHKQIALQKNCLVVTASQSNTARTGKKIDSGDFADDIRKLAIIDIGIALNQSLAEKNNHIMKVSVIAHRHEQFDTQKEVFVLYQHEIGKPILDSTFINILKGEE